MINHELRGWKEICEFLNVKDWKTARAMLDRRNLLVYDGRSPILNREVWNHKSKGSYGEGEK